MRLTEREREREIDEKSRAGCTLAVCRKNNGSFNYRIDCAKFLSLQPLFFHFILSSFFGLPLLPLSEIARSLVVFFCYFSVRLPIFAKQSSSERCRDASSESRASYSLRIRQTHEFAPDAWALALARCSKTKYFPGRRLHVSERTWLTRRVKRCNNLIGATQLREVSHLLLFLLPLFFVLFFRWVSNSPNSRAVA